MRFIPRHAEIDGQTVDEEIVDAAGENAKPSALENLKIAEGDVAAILQRDGFVAYALNAAIARIVAVRAVAAHEAASPDAPWAVNGNVVQVHTPDEAIVPVIVPEVLISLPQLRGLGIVVAAGLALGRRIRGNDHRAPIEKKGYVAFEVDGIAEIISGGTTHGSSTGGSGCLDGAIDGR